MDQNNTSTESNINSTINAITGLAKEIPVYQDAVQPAAQEVGKSLQTVAKTINIALAPIKALVWGYEKIEEYISKRVTEKLTNIPTENIVTPDPRIVVPAIESLRYTGNKENLRELYANLIANSMDKNTLKNTHPSFVEILKNINSDEGILLQAFAINQTHAIIDINAEQNGGFISLLRNCVKFHENLNIKYKDLIPSYLDNLIRLGLLEIPENHLLLDVLKYEEIENSPVFSNLKFENENLLNRKIIFNRKIIRTTSFGYNFIKTVVTDK